MHSCGCCWLHCNAPGSQATHVPLRQAQPGDLIFWASDPSDPATIYHVAISLGGDRTVQALRTGENVQVVDLWGEDLVPLATRP